MSASNLFGNVSRSPAKAPKGATTKKRQRGAIDFYETPQGATKLLLALLNPRGTFFEPCAGDGAISKVLAEYAEAQGNGVMSADLRPETGADITPWDASDRENWERLVNFDWVISNPPFNVAPSIIPHAVNHAIAGCCMLLRLTYLEPCGNRVDFLREHPPDFLLVMPRISFRQTEKSKTDNVTTAWVVWYAPMNWDAGQPRGVRIVGPEEMKEILEAL